MINLKNIPYKAGSFIKQFVFELGQETREGIDKIKNLTQTNYELGVEHFKKGNITDAILRFRMIILFVPVHYKSYYYLGRCLLLRDEPEKALKCFARALEFDPTFSEAAFMINKIRGKVNDFTFAPTNIPTELIREHLSERIEKPIVANWKEICNLVIGQIRLKRDDKLSALEFSCGNGEIGSFLKEQGVVSNIRATELVPSMREKALALKDASGKRIYDSIYNALPLDIFRSSDEMVDLIVVSDLNYYSAQSLAMHLKDSMTDNGILVILARKTDSDKVDMKEDMFMYPKDRIVNIFTDSYFALMHASETRLPYGENNMLYVFYLKNQEERRATMVMR